MHPEFVANRPGSGFGRASAEGGEAGQATPTAPGRRKNPGQTETPILLMIPLI
jgi:hypothetical protein